MLRSSYTHRSVLCSDSAVCLSREGRGGARVVSLSEVLYVDGMCCLLSRPKLLLRGASQQGWVEIVQASDMFTDLKDTVGRRKGQCHLVITCFCLSVNHVLYTMMHCCTAPALSGMLVYMAPTN